MFPNYKQHIIWVSISTKQTNVVGQEVVVPPLVNINHVTLKVVDSVRYIGPIATRNLVLNIEISMRIANDAAVMYSNISAEKCGAMIN